MAFSFLAMVARIEESHLAINGLHSGRLEVGCPDTMVCWIREFDGEVCPTRKPKRPTLLR